MATMIETPKLHNTLRYQRIPFSEIHEVGAYVNIDTGSLFRIPEEALAHGRSPVMEIVSLAGPTVCKVCDDPWVPISKARQLAADGDIQINF
jgi:hypothetical protein